MTTPREMIVAVDRLEGAKAVLESDDGTHFIVAAASLPGHPAEGHVYRITLGSAGNPDWASAVRDMDEERRRKDDLSARMRKLTRHDKGGDIEL
jgi:DUF3006 family protein